MLSSLSFLFPRSLSLVGGGPSGCGASADRPLLLSNDPHHHHHQFIRPPCTCAFDSPILLLPPPHPADDVFSSSALGARGRLGRAPCARAALRPGSSSSSDRLLPRERDTQTPITQTFLEISTRETLLVTKQPKETHPRERRARSKLTTHRASASPPSLLSLRALSLSLSRSRNFGAKRLEQQPIPLACAGQAGGSKAGGGAQEGSMAAAGAADVEQWHLRAPVEGNPIVFFGASFWFFTHRRARCGSRFRSCASAPPPACRAPTVVALLNTQTPSPKPTQPKPNQNRHQHRRPARGTPAHGAVEGPRAEDRSVLVNWRRGRPPPHRRPG